MRMKLVDQPTPGKPDPDKEVIWCQAPLHNAAPYIKHTEEQVRNSYSAVGLVAYPHWPNTKAHKMLQSWEQVHTYPAGTDLFEAPTQVKGKRKTQHGVHIERGKTTRGPRPQPPKPTQWPVHIYKIMAQPQTELPDITEATHAQAGMLRKQQPYIFKARVATTRACVNVRAGGNFSILSEEQANAAKENPEKLKEIAVLGDTGATHSLVTLRVAKQLGVKIDPNRTGTVILGDGHSGVPIQGECIVPIKLGKYSCEVRALVRLGKLTTFGHRQRLDRSKQSHARRRRGQRAPDEYSRPNGQGKSQHICSQSAQTQPVGTSGKARQPNNIRPTICGHARTPRRPHGRRLGMGCSRFPNRKRQNSGSVLWRRTSPIGEFHG